MTITFEAARNLCVEILNVPFPSAAARRFSAIGGGEPISFRRRASVAQR